jgi:hypothetical protein
MSVALVDDSDLRSQLGLNEKLLWSGRPQQGLRLQLSDALFIPFSLLWGGFACFWEWSVIQSGAPFFFRLWGIPFVLVGIYMIVGRFFWEAYRRSQTQYGVTSERVMILSKGRTVNLKSLQLRTLSDVSLTVRSDATGSIQFGNAGPFSGATWMAQSGWPGARAVPMFDTIEDAKRVYDLVCQAQRSAA